MSVTVDVCKDIEKFKESVVAGFDAKHSLVIGGALIAGGITGAVCIIILHIPAMVSSYLMIPVCAPIILIGFSEEEGMGFFEKHKKKKLMKKMKLYNISTESFQSIKILEKNLEKEMSDNNAESLGDEEVKKIIMLLIGGVSAIVLIFIIAAALIIILR